MDNMGTGTEIVNPCIIIKHKSNIILIVHVTETFLTSLKKIKKEMQISNFLWPFT